MKSIPIDLVDHKTGGATTLCYIQRVGPLPDGSYLAFTSLSHDIEADPDGSGTLVYRASTGMQVSEFAATSGLEVDNGETESLIAAYPVPGITEAMVDSGALDGVEYWIWQINFADPSQGAEVMANGPIGEVRILEGGQVTWENRSWSQLLKQNSICERDSLTCRVRQFGSQPDDERFPCMYDATGEWVTGAVSAVGAEAVREFWSDDLGQADDYFAPGLVRWLTGANAGMTREVEAFAGGYVSLGFTARHPIAVDDTFEIRRDCTRNWAGHNSCETYSNRRWFRGEPWIPVADSMALSTPAGSGGA